MRVNSLGKSGRVGVWASFWFGTCLALFSLGMLAGDAKELSTSCGQTKWCGSVSCLQLSFVPERAQRILKSWGKRGRSLALKIHKPGDTLLPLGYGLLLWGLFCVLILGGVDFARPFVWMGPLAALCDLTENVLLVGLIQQFSESTLLPSGTLLWMSSLAATKYTLLFLCSLMLVWRLGPLLLRKAPGLRANRALLGYGLFVGGFHIWFILARAVTCFFYRFG